MYEVTSNGVAVYADSIVPIKYHTNGCYVPCPLEQAGGFCAKQAVLITDEEGERWQTADTVYQLSEGSLKGDEPIGSFTETSGAEIITEQEQELTALAAGITEGVNSIVDDE
jgi:hypothetical protein